MPLSVHPPIAPMLARLTRELPLGDLSYEPKWDGFRCLAFVDERGVDLRSRHDRPLARYFPEVVTGLEAVRDARARTFGEANAPFAADGELLLARVADADADDDRETDAANEEAADDDGTRETADTDGRPPAPPVPAFAGLMTRLHPAATRVERLSREMPAVFIAFDLLADGERDLRDLPFVERRAALEAVVGEGNGQVALTPSTRDPSVARRWFTAGARAIDGVVAKPDDLPYAAGRRLMTKVKRERTAECVVAGARLLPDGSVSSLLLGLYDDQRALRHVGVVTQLPRTVRVSLARELEGLVVPLDRHSWREGFLIGASPLGRLKGSAARWRPDMDPDWLPLRPELVAEVAFDQVDVDRFRHPARLVRWRPDRDPGSCRLDQVTADAAAGADDVDRAAAS